MWSEYQQLSSEASGPKETQGPVNQTTKARKSRPSVDINLARDLKKLQKLPIVGQGQDPGVEKGEQSELKPTHSQQSTPPRQGVEGNKGEGYNGIEEGHTVLVIWNGESIDWAGEEEEEEAEPQVDRTTGRTMCQDPQPCLRCQKKGLKCTLIFASANHDEKQPKCSACRRSDAQYCVRLRPANRRIPYYGPPWKNPNFTTGSAVSDHRLSSVEIGALLKGFYLGEQSYVGGGGSYLYQASVEAMALPPYNGVDLPMEERARNWKTMGWRHVLPVWHNASLQSGGLPPSDQVEWTAADSVEEGSPVEAAEEAGRDQLQYLRIRRRYFPREAHLNDELGETW
ncbi:Uu.00g003400.m01.CDS01 [Anthostomella pinea]|uniref:Uu.00g003400.m01.CDS01 n=1 Tax=Anthostomella pinea TaxID=933095 RepID=A0AAI8YIP5_9PEZI|nr:Uu.00g003400.m01.CDS01 [Anthostomella pinea]